MQENWKELRKFLITEYKDVFNNLITPKYLGVDFENAVDLFRKIVLFETAHTDLNGLENTFFKHLKQIASANIAILNQL